MDMMTPLFFIGSSSNLQITRTGMRCEMSLKLGHIALFTLLLVAEQIPYLTCFDLLGMLDLR